MAGWWGGKVESLTSTGSGWRDGKGYAVSEREDESESWDFDVSIGASDFLGTIGLRKGPQYARRNWLRSWILMFETQFGFSTGV